MLIETYMNLSTPPFYPFSSVYITYNMSLSQLHIMIFFCDSPLSPESVIHMSWICHHPLEHRLYFIVYMYAILKSSKNTKKKTDECEQFLTPCHSHDTHSSTIPLFDICGTLLTDVFISSNTRSTSLIYQIPYL